MSYNVYLKNERNFDLIISQLICTYAHGRFLDGSDNIRLTDWLYMWNHYCDCWYKKSIGITDTHIHTISVEAPSKHLASLYKYFKHFHFKK